MINILSITHINSCLLDSQWSLRVQNYCWHRLPSLSAAWQRTWKRDKVFIIGEFIYCSHREYAKLQWWRTHIIQSPNIFFKYSSVQSLSHARLFETPWTAACQASLSITNSRSPPKPMSLEYVWAKVVSAKVVFFKV